MADEEVVEFEAIQEDYQLPDDFVTGVGEVRGYNESLPNYYSSLAAMVNKIRRLKAKLAKQYQRWVYLQIDRDVAELKGMRDDALAWIEKINKLGGIPFEMPQELENALNGLFGAPKAEKEDEEDEDKEKKDAKEEEHDNDKQDNDEKKEEEDDDDSDDEEDGNEEDESDDGDDDEEEEDDEDDEEEENSTDEDEEEEEDY